MVVAVGLDRVGSDQVVEFGPSVQPMQWSGDLPSLGPVTLIDNEYLLDVEASCSYRPASGGQPPSIQFIGTVELSDLGLSPPVQFLTGTVTSSFGAGRTAPLPSPTLTIVIDNLNSPVMCPGSGAPIGMASGTLTVDGTMPSGDTYTFSIVES